MSCVTKCDEGGGEITFSLKCVTSFMDVPTELCRSLLIQRQGRTELSRYCVGLFLYTFHYFLLLPDVT